MTAQTALSFRKAGTNEWVDIDPLTPGGQRLLALFGISITTEEQAMSATGAQVAVAAAGNGPGGNPRLVVVPGANKENMGALLRGRRALREYTDRARQSVARAWAWIVRTTHLDTAWEYVKRGAAWVGDKIAAGARFLGGGGMIGVGLLGIATETGRKVISGVLRPVGWLLGMFGRAYVGVENMLHSDEREGGIRNWISRRMAGARVWMFGDENKSNKIGVLPSAMLWGVKHLGKHFHLDSMAMRLSRSAGALLLAPRLMDLLMLLPIGPLYWPLRFIATLAIGYFVWVPVSGTVTTIWDRMSGAVREDLVEADKTVTKTANVIKGEVVEEVEKEDARHAREVRAAEKEAAATATHAPATPRGRNRGERRAAQQTPARA